jgi:hypothetical protein
MSELNNYTGEFRPDVKLSDFSKEALIQLVRAAAKCYAAQTSYWWTAAKELYGEETANKLQEHVWLKGGASEAELRNVCTALKINGHDIPSYFKFLQMTPIDATMMDLDFEIKDTNHGTLTVTRCYSLNVMERTKDLKFQKNICEIVDGRGFQLGGTWFNPRMKVTPVKLPPRQSKTDIACKWEFAID